MIIFCLQILIWFQNLMKYSSIKSAYVGMRTSNQKPGTASIDWSFSDGTSFSICGQFDCSTGVGNFNICFFNQISTMSKGFFQCSLFLKIRILVSWLMPTLLLKNKCFDTHIYLKARCLQTNKTQHNCGKESAWEAGWIKKRVALIKSLIYPRKKRRAWGAFVKDRLEPNLYNQVELV